MSQFQGFPLRVESDPYAEAADYLEAWRKGSGYP